MKNVHVFQFGEGNFLRTFVEHYFDTLNEEGYTYRVTIARPIPMGAPLSLFTERDCRYHILLRGVKDGCPCEQVREIRAVDDVFSPFEDYDAFLRAARDPDLRLIVSNTTEAGICFSPTDTQDGFASITFPAKLTKLLYERYRAGLSGVYMLPVELIDHNADALKDCVDRYIDLWGLPEAFRTFNDTHNYYCNTLVDRIVSGAPKTDADRAYAKALVGEDDPLLSVGEPFGLWVVEERGALRELLPEGLHGIEVVLTDSVDPYKKRKVRILNGSHTNLVPVGILQGLTTVFDCMNDAAVRRFILGTVEEEILPTLTDDLAAARTFANAMVGRFENPYLDHRLTSIALNSISKWRSRVLPTVKAYVQAFSKLPRRLTVGFACLMALYSRIRHTHDGYVAELPYGTVPMVDDRRILAYFADGGTVRDFMKDARYFGCDLTEIDGFAEAVERHLAVIAQGGVPLDELV